MGKNKSWTIWFTSDPHFGHEQKDGGGVIRFCNRPYENMADMMNQVRKKWNAKVKPEDQVIFVGDVFFYLNKQEAKEYLDSLNGRKILVRGNHDRKSRDMYGMGFDFVCEEMTMLIANERVTISHYPFKIPKWKHNYFNLRHRLFRFLGIKGSWAVDNKFYARRPEDKGQFLIHGHTHSKKKIRGRMIHVGMDAWDCEPIPMDTIGNIISQMKEQNQRNKK